VHGCLVRRREPEMRVTGEDRTAFICVTCGTQFAESPHPPDSCPICLDERQYVRWEGQAWTDMEALEAGHTVRIETDGELLGVGMDPRFAIGQRALLVPHGDSNLLWDCVPLLDQGAVEKILSAGGISGIAISHPHYYSSMVEWSGAFGDIPVYLHAADREWVMRHAGALHFWEGDALALGDGLTLHRLGGHFEGGTVLHWEGGAHGKGVLLASDIIQVARDRRWVSFMYSYPNYIPLPTATVLRIKDWIRRIRFERIYGAWWGQNVMEGAREVVSRSAERYVDMVSGRRVL
jgi:hypothetical protein